MSNKIPSFDEILNGKIHWSGEDENNYYVTLELTPGINYDDSMWVIDKKTKKVSYRDALDLVFSDEYDGIKPVDLSTLKRVF